MTCCRYLDHRSPQCSWHWPPPQRLPSCQEKEKHQQKEPGLLYDIHEFSKAWIPCCLSSLQYCWTHIHLYENGRKSKDDEVTWRKCTSQAKNERERTPGSASLLLQSASMSGDKDIGDTSETCPHLKEILLKAAGSKIPHFNWHGLQREVQCLCDHSLLQTELREVGVSAAAGDAGGSFLQGPYKYVQPEFKKAGRKSTGEREQLSRKWRKMELKS